MKKQKQKVESQEGFEILEGLDGIRQNPTMYLGELGDHMAQRCLKEIVDNAYDEAIAGRNKLIEVAIDYDKLLYVVADGAGGIPTDFKKLGDGTKISIMTAAYSRTHAGGKFNNKAYKTSAGVHGVGASAVTAVSEEVRLWSSYKGKLVHQKFGRGRVLSGPDPKPVKSIDADVRALLQDKKYGTVSAFVLDQSVISEDARRGKALPKKFRVARANPNSVATWLKNVAMLNPGLTIKLRVILKGKKKDQVFLNKKDLAWVPMQMCADREFGTMGKPFVHKSDNISCCVIWSDHPDTDNFLSFVNTSPTVDGGWHVTGFVAALMNGVKSYIPVRKGKGGAGFTGQDLLIGLVGMFDWRMHGAQYTSQVKDRLASKVDREVYEELAPLFEQYFKKHPAVARAIIKRAQAVNKGREDLRRVVRSLADVKKKNRSNLPAALSVADKAKPHERELFIVEGDSAGGPAQDSRDANFQEVLCAGGKPLNALKAPLAKVLAHEEIQNMLVSMGVDLKSLDPKSDKPRLSTENLRIGHIIFLVDPDPDGSHIAVLFLAVLLRLMPDIFKEGRVWCVKAPLFAAVKDGKVYGGMTFKECRKAAPSSIKDKEITRIKGWGEVDETVLEPIAFNPKTRNLIRINPFADSEGEQFFRGVVAEDAVYRRRLLGLES